VLVAVGGGGLIGGIATWLGGRVRVVGVEPEGSCCLSAALEAGAPVDVTVESIAADSLGARNCGPRVFEVARRHVERVVLVPDEAIREAQRRLWRALRVAVEPGGAAALARACRGKKTSLKAALLDQRVVAGLGNIYVCEALHRARISPFKPAARISLPRLERLVEAVREVLRAAIAAGGSTLRDYASADGALGYFQHSFRVYDREGQPCPNTGCGGTIQRRMQGGRSTFHCPVCQR